MIYDIVAWIIVFVAFSLAFRQLWKVVGLFRKDVNPCSMCGNSTCQLKDLKNGKINHITTNKIS